MEISIVDLEPQLVLGMRKRGKYQEIAVLMSKIFPFAIKKGIQIQGPPIFVCHEMGAEEAMKADKEGNADIEVAVPISGKAEETDEIKCYELPGGGWQRRFIKALTRIAALLMRNSFYGSKKTIKR